MDLSNSEIKCAFPLKEAHSIQYKPQFAVMCYLCLVF